MTQEPDTKFIHIFVEEFSTTWVSAPGDVKDRFIRAFAAGANIFNRFVPFGQEPIHSRRFGYMFRELGVELSQKPLKNLWHAVPIYQIKIINVHNSFAVKSYLCPFVVVEATPCRSDEFLTIDVHSDVFERKIACNEGSKMKVTSASLASKSHLQFSFAARKRSKYERPPES